MKRKITDSEFIQVAIMKHHTEGELEIHGKDGTELPTAIVSRTGEADEEGAYVLAWVWVSNEDVETEFPMPDCMRCGDSGEVDGKGCTACCQHDERDHGICLDCGHEDDGSGSADWAVDRAKDPD